MSFLKKFYGSSSFDSKDEEIEKEDVANKLRARFGKEPSENDVFWGYYNFKSIQLASRGDWGGYRVIRYKMAEACRKEKKYDAAMSMYLEVFYLDFNDSVFSDDPNYKYANLIEKIVKLSKARGYDKEYIQDSFIKRAKIVHKAMKLPSTPEDCQKVLTSQLQNTSLNT